MTILWILGTFAVILFVGATLHRIIHRHRVGMHPDHPEYTPGASWKH